jgi:hypothetical protein
MALPELGRTAQRDGFYFGGEFWENLGICSRSRVGGATGGDCGGRVPAGWNLCAQVPGGTLRSGVALMAQPRYHIPEPQRVRRIAGSFAWIDHRLLRGGYLAVMTHAEQSLYLFLALAADRHGVSFYRQEKICALLGLDAQGFAVARDRLIELGLLAFEPYSVTSPNGFYQVLAVAKPAPDFAAQMGYVETLAAAFTPRVG